MARRATFYGLKYLFVSSGKKENRSAVLIVRFRRFNNGNNKHAIRQRDLLRFGVKLIAFQSG